MWLLKHKIIWYFGYCSWWLIRMCVCDSDGLNAVYSVWHANRGVKCGERALCANRNGVNHVNVFISEAGKRNTICTILHSDGNIHRLMKNESRMRNEMSYDFSKNLILCVCFFSVFLALRFQNEDEKCCNTNEFSYYLCDAFSVWMLFSLSCSVCVLLLFEACIIKWRLCDALWWLCSRQCSQR